MKPVLIYFKEVPFKENKFVLDFSNEKFVQAIDFSRNEKYFIATLDCKLKLKEFIQESDNVKKLDAKSKKLNDEGSDYFCDIDYLQLVTLKQFKNAFTRQYKFERDNDNIENYNFEFQYWNLKEKKIEKQKIYSPFSQLISKGLTFSLDANIGFNTMKLVTQVDKENSKLQSFFIHTHASNKTEYLNYSLGEAYYRDINLFYVYDPKFKQWQTTQPEFFREAIYAKSTNQNFNEKAFAKKYYDDEKKGRFVIGTFAQRLRLGDRKYMMPITFIFGNLRLFNNEPFYTANIPKTNSFLKQDGISDLGSYTLTKDDLKELNNMLSNFQLKNLCKWMKVKNSRQTCEQELTFYPQTRYGSLGQPIYNIANFQATSQKMLKYKDWLNTDNEIFLKPYLRNLSSTLKKSEELFDKDVLEIKKLVKDIGNIEKITQSEQTNLILYDNISIIKETFFTKLKKNILSYGIISINYNYNTKTLINWKNKLKFTIQKSIKKEFLTFQLEDAIEPKQVVAEDEKMTNVTILKLDEEINANVIDSFIIEGIQKFENFKTLNPLSVQVIDPNIRNSIGRYSRSNYRYKYRFIVNSLLFSSLMESETATIFITANELIDAKEIVINGKFFKAIGAIYTTEIENWKEIKKQSNWVSVTLTDSKIPIVAKHFAFSFETNNFNRLLNFEYSLLDDNGELINFKKSETKVPALNFTIEVLK